MILKVQNIAKSFGKNKVLEDISFEMESSTLVGIVGENGSGKSTLLKIIIGEWNYDKGQISVFDRIGYCPQETLLFSSLTVKEHFKYFAAAYGIEKDALQVQSEALMSYFNFKKFENKKIEHLSGGTKQKLSLSIALLHQPKLLILDEPYNGFDWHTYLKFWEYAEKLRANGCAILVVAHLLTETTQFNQVYNLEHGRLQ